MLSSAVTVPYPRRFASAGRELEPDDAEREPFDRATAGFGACLAWPEKLYRLAALVAAGSRLVEAGRALVRGAGFAGDPPFVCAPLLWPLPLAGAGDFALHPLVGLGAWEPFPLAGLPLLPLAKLRGAGALRRSPLRASAVPEALRLWAGFALRDAVPRGALGRGLRGRGAGALELAALVEEGRATARAAGTCAAEAEISTTFGSGAAEAATSTTTSSSDSTSTALCTAAVERAAARA